MCLSLRWRKVRVQHRHQHHSASFSRIDQEITFVGKLNVVEMIDRKPNSLAPFDGVGFVAALVGKPAVYKTLLETADNNCAWERRATDFNLIPAASCCSIQHKSVVLHGLNQGNLKAHEAGEFMPHRRPLTASDFLSVKLNLFFPRLFVHCGEV